MRKKSIKFVKDLQKNQPQREATWELEDLFVIYVDLSDSGTSLSFGRFSGTESFSTKYICNIHIYLIIIYLN